jgi:hypothetical protein
MGLLKKAPPPPEPKPRVQGFGPVIDDAGNIRFLSVSQLEKFDASVYGGCERRWWFRYVQRRPEKQTKNQKLGDQVHAQAEHYLKTGEDVLGDIIRAGKRFLPRPGADLIIERQFAQLEWPGPLESPVVSDLVAAGVPLIGKGDLLHARGEWVDDAGIVHPDPDAFEAFDHKTTKQIDDVIDPDIGIVTKKGLAKKAEELADTWQMTGYGVLGHKLWPDKRFARLGHGYYQTQGPRAASKRSMLVPVDRILARWRQADDIVEHMKEVARTKRVQDVRPNYDSCTAYGGCPHRSDCPKDDAIVFRLVFGSHAGSLVQRLGQGERNDPMSLLKKRQEALAAQGAAQGGTPSTPANTAIVVAELERLKAEEAAIKKGGAAALSSLTPPDMPPPQKTAEPHAPESQLPPNIRVEAACGHTVPYDQTSQLPNGTIKHIGCAGATNTSATPAALTKPAPVASTPPSAPVTGTADAVCSATGTTIECTVDVIASKKLTCATCGTEKLKAKPNKLGDGKYYTLVPKHDVPGSTAPIAMPPKAEAPAPTPTPPPPAHAAPTATIKPVANIIVVNSEENKPEERQEESLGSLHLYLDCTVDGAALPRLEKYADELATALCAEYKAMDVRCAPEGSVLAFGKWKGAIAACAKANPPEPGAYAVSSTSEIAMVVFEALATLGRGLVVRGAR